MGSRIMHLIIANKIAECLQIEDRPSFLYGSVAPDAVSTKDTSHFFEGEIQNYTRYIDYKGFLNKYSTHKESAYIVGYFTHLIADDIWLKGFNLPWFRNRMEADKELYNLHHNDFRLLNGKLLEYYGFRDELRMMLSYPTTIIELDEVKSKDVEAFIPYVLDDMEYNKEAINEQLNIYRFIQIIGYIETATELGIVTLKTIHT
jgi:hypothetical protein